MSTQSATVFFSYARLDADFVLRVAKALRDDGISVWIDQLDIPWGARWDESVETALRECSCLVVVMSPASVSSQNVLDEVGFALEDRKTVMPLLLARCTIPFRLKRIQHIDFTIGYELGYSQLLAALRRLRPQEAPAPAPQPVAAPPTPPPMRAPEPEPERPSTELRRQRRVSPPRARPAAPPRGARPAAPARTQDAAPPVGPPVPRPVTDPPASAARQPGEAVAVAGQPAVPPEPVVPAAEPVVPEPEPVVPPGEPVAPEEPPASPAREPVAPPAQPDGSPVGPVRLLRQHAVARAEPALAQPAPAKPPPAPEAPKDGTYGPVPGPDAPVQGAAAPHPDPLAPVVPIAAAARRAAAKSVQATVRSRQAAPPPARPVTQARHEEAAPVRSAAQSRQGAAPSNSSPTQWRHGPPLPPALAAQSRQADPAPARPAAPPPESAPPPASPATPPREPDAAARAPQAPLQPRTAAPERHEDTVFYFEPAPASDSPGPGSGGEAPPDDGPVLLPPVRRGRYVAAGVAGLAAAGAAAYFLTPLGQQVDALLAPEAPPLVIARGTSVGSAQLPPDVVPPPPREAAPPAAKAPAENQGTPATSPVPAPVQGEEKPPTIERNKHQADAAAAAPKKLPAPSGQRDVKPVTKQQKEEGRPAAKADEDVLAADEEPAAPEHAAGEAEVMGLVRRYVTAQDNSDIDGLVALYDDRVDFHEYKLAGPDYIRNYRREFFEKWPKVETVLVGQVEINWSDSTTANVVFTTSIHVREPPLENPGRTKNKLTVRVTHGALKIVSEHQEVQVAPS